MHVLDLVVRETEYKVRGVKKVQKKANSYGSLIGLSALKFWSPLVVSAYSRPFT